jgi:hypothetical protein
MREKDSHREQHPARKGDSDIKEPAAHGILKRGGKGRQRIVGLESAHGGMRSLNSSQRPFPLEIYG